MPSACVAEQRGAEWRIRNVGYGMRILNLEYPVSGSCITRSTHHALQYRYGAYTLLVRFSDGPYYE